MIYYIVKTENVHIHFYLIEAETSSSRSGNVIANSSNVKSFIKKGFMFKGQGIIGKPKILYTYKTKEEALTIHFELFL